MSTCYQRLIFVVVLSVALGMVGPAGQAFGATDPVESTAKACDLGFVPNRPIQGVGSVIGTAWTQCDAPPQAHVMVVGLERRQGNAWVRVAAAAPDARIPSGPPQRTTYQVSTTCQPGVWRVIADARGATSDGVPFEFSDASAVAFFQCTRG